MPPANLRRHPDDFNSSDIEFDEEDDQETRPSFGQASITKLIENAFEDRISTKSELKALKFGHGAPCYRENQLRWAARLEAFRKHTLNQDITTPFTGNDLIRFLSAIIGM